MERGRNNRNRNIKRNIQFIGGRNNEKSYLQYQERKRKHCGEPVSNHRRDRLYIHKL